MDRFIYLLLNFDEHLVNCSVVLEERKINKTDQLYAIGLYSESILLHHDSRF